MQESALDCINLAASSGDLVSANTANISGFIESQLQRISNTVGIGVPTTIWSAEPLIIGLSVINGSSKLLLQPVDGSVI